MERKLIRYWRGKRSTYNKLESYDYWTRYSIIEPDGSITETFGNKRVINEPTGQLLPVVDVVDSLESIDTPKTGDRCLLLKDGEYYIYTIFMGGKTAADEELQDDEINLDSCKIEKFNRNMSVRIMNRGLKCYQIVEGELYTYDDVNGGTFD